MNAKKKNRSYLAELAIPDQRKLNPKIMRMVLSDQYTRIDLGYVAPWIYIGGGWIRIAPYTFLQVHGSEQRYKLIRAENIPIAPDRHDFESIQDWKVFTLYFEPIPIANCVLDMIEEEEPDENDFNYSNLEIINLIEIIE